MSTRVLLAVVPLVACAPAPYFTLKGPPMTTATLSSVQVDASGIQLVVDARCTREAIEHWCPLSNPQCSPKPIIVRHEPASCKAAAPTPTSVRTPWGKLYSGTGTAVAIDWRESGIDPLAPDAAQALATGWHVSSESLGLDMEYKPNEVELETIRQVIGAATDTQYDLDPSAKPTQITVAMIDAGSPNTVTIAVTNSGTVPAYRVVAKLRSSHGPIHNTQVSFGRIDPQTTKTRSRVVVGLLNDGDDATPMVLAEVAGANADRANANRRITLTRETSGGVVFECEAHDKEVVPGQRVRIECNLTNNRSAPIKGLSYTLSVADGKPTPNSGPAELAAGDHVKIELALVMPADAKSQQKVELHAAVTGAGISLQSTPIVMQVSKLETSCVDKKLTQDEYRVKRKRLQAARDSGALTQDEFDKYDADLIGCLQ